MALDGTGTGGAGGRIEFEPGGWAQDWARREQTVHVPADPPTHRPPARISVQAYSEYFHGGRWRPEETPLSGASPGALLATDEWLAYDLSVADGATDELRLLVAAVDDFGGGEVGVVVDDEPVARFTFDPTGGWEDWAALDVPVTLEPGSHTLELHVLEGGWKLSALALR